MTDQEKRDILSFVVVGGGPTGIEFAAELNDFITEDLKKWFPHLIDKVSISVIQSREHILNTFDSNISTYTEKLFSRNNIDIKTMSRVKEVKENSIMVLDKNTNQVNEYPFGLCLWSTGITKVPITSQLCESLGTDIQTNRRAILVDHKMKVKGSNNIFAIG
eukprot:TRINITY_DN4885_c0_g1_i1.p1 TRINITY_DN4885_c0_g1~~TRINITY_DN4885_c0_g1_i1.p1  ORF type:complete len:162 (+),score=27.66 TRINITY_DN4885_c0_g1_i1:808-1293(+)